MQGDDKGNFNPDAFMTRAEAAQLFYNLLKDKNVEITESFIDVPDGAWYATAMRVLASLDIITGYPDGTARPDAQIIRAEFVTMVSRFEGLTTGGPNFPDVPSNYWAYKYINSSAAKGWITGYLDGTFRPANNITRSEATKLVNALLGRKTDEDFINKNSESLRNFPDLTKAHWAYYEIMEATNSHRHSIHNGKESWNSLG